jgi:hypothetical protein
MSCSRTNSTWRILGANSRTCVRHRSYRPLLTRSHDAGRWKGERDCAHGEAGRSRMGDGRSGDEAPFIDAAETRVAAKVGPSIVNAVDRALVAEHPSPSE